MSAHQINSLFHFDHYPIPHSQGGPDEPWNLQPRLIAEHREKTAKQDIPQIAKTKRISKKHEEFRARILAKGEEKAPSKSRWPKRRWK